jgi:hypothetical protein
MHGGLAGQRDLDFYRTRDALVGVQTTTGRAQCMVVGATFFLIKKEKEKKIEGLAYFF